MSFYIAIKTKNRADACKILAANSTLPGEVVGFLSAALAIVGPDCPVEVIANGHLDWSNVGPSNSVEISVKPIFFSKPS
jgi:hypothetical protein